MMMLQGLFNACSSAHQAAQAEECSAMQNAQLSDEVLRQSAKAMQNAQPANVQQQQFAVNLIDGLQLHPIFGCTIRWRGETYEVGGCELPDEAKIKAIWMAEKQGWTNPRWYEAWRIWRGDTWFDPAEIARLKAKYEGDNQLSEEVS